MRGQTLLELDCVDNQATVAQNVTRNATENVRKCKMFWSRFFGQKKFILQEVKKYFRHALQTVHTVIIHDSSGENRFC